MICYAFPLAHEASETLKRVTLKEQFSIGRLHCTLGRLDDRQVLIALIGMGQEQARVHMETVFEYFRIKAVVLAGYGGALIPQLKVGQIVVSNNFTSSEVQPFLRLMSGFDFACFCTSSEVICTPAARDRYARETGSQVAEMETAPVAHLVRSREIPFIAVRAISDDYPQVLPARALAAGYDAGKGEVTPLRLLRHLAMHPSEIKPFSRFVSGLVPTRLNLTNFVQQLNAELPGSW